MATNLTTTLNIGGTDYELGDAWAREQLKMTGLKHYTAIWDGVNAQMTRANDAADITTDTTNFKHSGVVNENYNNPFDFIYPWSSRKLCNIDLAKYRALESGDSITECVSAWEGELGFSYEDEYGVWVYTPPFYGAAWDVGGKRWYDVTNESTAGNRYYPEQITGRWLGCDVTLTIDGTSKHCNLPRVGMPMANVALSTQHTYAKNYGGSLIDIYTLDASTLLYLVEYADMNSQRAIGNGVSSLYVQGQHVSADVTDSNTIVMTAANANYVVGAVVDIGTSDGGNQIARTYITAVDGATLTLADAVTVTTANYVSIHGMVNMADEGIGSMTGYLGGDGKSTAYYRGENLCGNKYQYVLGMYRQTGTNEIWVAERGDTYNYDALNTSKHVDTGLALPTVSSASWQWTGKLSLVGGLATAPVIASVGGNATNPVGDQQYIPLATMSNTVLLFGGAAFFGSGVGVFCASWGSAASYSGWSGGSRPRLINP